MLVLIAALPFLVALILLAVLRWSGRDAGCITLIVAMLLGSLVPAFAAGLSFSQQATRLGLALGTGAGSALVVLGVLLPGILLFHLEERSGGISALARGLERLSPNPHLRLLILVLGFAPFVESVSGFGVCVIVTVPLALAMGFDPLRAAIIGLLTQIAVPWGALGVGTVIGAQITHLPLGQLGGQTAIMIAPLPTIFGLVALGISAGWRAIARWWAAAALAGGVMVGLLWWLSQAIGVELAGVLASSGVLLTLAVWARIAARGQVTSDIPSPPAGGLPPRPDYPVWRALLPYVVLTGLLLISRLVGPLRDWLQQHVVLAIPAFDLQLPLLYTPGFWVLLAVLVAIPSLGMPWEGAEGTPSTRAALARGWRQFVPSGLAITAFLMAAAVMERIGLTGVLGDAATQLGSAFGVITPALGAFGGWLTGSVAGGNAMFATLQQTASRHTRLAPTAIMGAQNGAAGYGSVASPARIVLAATTAKSPGGEGVLLRAVGPWMLVSIAIITFMLLVVH